MKNILILSLAVLVFSCKKETTPEPSAPGGGSSTVSDSATYEITATSNHRRALFIGECYPQGGSNYTVFMFNLNQAGSIYQDLPITKTIRIFKNDSVKISLQAKNSIPSELTDNVRVWSTLKIKKNGIQIYNHTDSIPSTQTGFNNGYMINGKN